MNEAYFIAKHLQTDYQSKKHGGYEIYEDEKILIKSDTYYPNLDVWVKDGDKKVLVLLRSGHGYNQEYHPGKWEVYIHNVLMPRAIEAKNKKDAEFSVRQVIEKQSKTCPVNDEHIFKEITQ